MKPEYCSKMLSICIPTYNRGHRALDVVNSLLGMKCFSQRNDLEIVVSNNGSTDFTDEYDKIESMSSESLIYNRFDHNMNFYGNFNAVVKLSRGRYCLLLSDEDTVDEDILTDLLFRLDDMSTAGVIKTKTSVQYSDFNATGWHAKAGYDAIKAYFLAGNYISGTIYNRRIVTNELIDGLCGLYENNEGYFHYPHMFVEGFVLSLSDFIFYDKCLIIEGKAEKNQPKAQNVNVPVWSSWESRVGQLEGYLRLIRDMQQNDEITGMMFQIAVWRTACLVELVKDYYVDSGEDWAKIRENAGNSILNIVSKCNIPLVENNMSRSLSITAELIKTNLLR